MGIAASAPAFQARDAGSTPAARSISIHHNKGNPYGYEESYEAYGEERNSEDGSEGTFEILPQKSRNAGFKEKEISPLFGQRPSKFSPEGLTRPEPSAGNPREHYA